MREIKFRAWDTEENKWYKPVYRAYEGKLFEILIGMNGCVVTRNMDGVGIGLPRFEIMQYTGFKTNGIDIYDGDILTNDGGWWYVEWSQDEGQWECHPILGGNVWTNLGEIVPNKETWVKGNIYQNPELLN